VRDASAAAAVLPNPSRPTAAGQADALLDLVFALELVIEMVNGHGAGDSGGGRRSRGDHPPRQAHRRAGLDAPFVAAAQQLGLEAQLLGAPD